MNTDSPPSCVIATSNESRVRRLGLWKMSARDFWASSWCFRPARRSALSLAATEKSRSTSARVRSTNDNRSGFMRRAPWVVVSAAAACSRPRVGPRVGRLEAAPRDVRVDLGGGEVLVAEQLLDRPQIGAAVEEVAREAVAERV